MSRLYKKLGQTFDVQRAERVKDDALATRWQRYEALFSQTNIQTWP